MRANELRIGNHGKEITHSKNRITKTTKQHFENIEKGEIDLFPIPLTEDWLLKFGFKKSEDVINQNNNYVNTGRYWIQEHIEADEFIFYGIDNSIELVLKHVHQLQNLYFALTGQELTIKQ